MWTAIPRVSEGDWILRSEDDKPFRRTLSRSYVLPREGGSGSRPKVFPESLLSFYAGDFPRESSDGFTLALAKLPTRDDFLRVIAHRNWAKILHETTLIEDR
jgi:hypothetical protein